MRIVALAGGVGAARFLRGLVRVVPASELTVVVNTADDIDMHGLRVCPDLDSITYTLGGGADTARGWGQADETYTVATQLAERYGQADWFTLGDKDIATHLFRSKLLAEGVGLSAVTAQIAAAWGLQFTLLPMTDDPVTTRIHTVDGQDLHFQQWWVRERAAADVARVEFAGAGSAAPAPGALEALDRADAVVLCPSNPVVSIEPILAVPGIAEAVAIKPVVGVSPIVGGRVVRGMADRLLSATGTEVSAAGVARRYRAFLSGWVVDDQDADQVDEISAGGPIVSATDTIMDSVEVAESVARTTVELARSLVR